MFYFWFLLLGIWFLRANKLMKQILMLGCFRSGLDGEEKEWIARKGREKGTWLEGRSWGENVCVAVHIHVMWLSTSLKKGGLRVVRSSNYGDQGAPPLDLIIAVSFVWCVSKVGVSKGTGGAHPLHLISKVFISKMRYLNLWYYCPFFSFSAKVLLSLKNLLLVEEVFGVNPKLKLSLQRMFHHWKY